MPIVACHYYETHIVLDLPLGMDKEDEKMRTDGLEKIKTIARGHGFWYSALEDDDSNEEHQGDIIFTTRDENYERMRARMKDASEDLTKNGLKVTRMKIEAAIFDTKEGDAL